MKKDSVATRNRILETTLEVIDQGGVETVSMRQIARTAGISIGTLTYYFGNKDALIEGCIDSYYDELEGLRDSIVASLMSSSSPQEMVRASTRILFRWSLEHRKVIRLRNLMTLQRGGHYPDTFNQRYLPMIEKGSAILSQLTGHSLQSMRIFVQTLNNTVGRMALHSDDELLAISQAPDVEQAFKSVEDVLGDWAAAYLFPAAVAG